jgi:hypothetical protein
VPFICDLLAIRPDRIDPISVRLAVTFAISIAGFCSRSILLLRPKPFYASFYAGGEKVITNLGIVSAASPLKFTKTLGLNRVSSPEVRQLFICNLL